MPRGIVGWLVFAAFVAAVYFIWTNYIKTRVR